MPRGKIRFVCSGRVSIPWAEQLAVVAAIDPVAHFAAQFGINGSFVLDCQVRNTPPRIEFFGAYDCLGWAYGNACIALTACIFDGTVTQVQRCIGINLSEKKPRTDGLIQEQGMFAHPPQSGLCAERFFEYWCGVGERSVMVPRQSVVDFLCQSRKALS